MNRKTKSNKYKKTAEEDVELRRKGQFRRASTWDANGSAKDNKKMRRDVKKEIRQYL